MNGLREAEALLAVLLLGLAALLAARTALGLALHLLAALPGAAGRGCRAAAEHVTPRLVRRLLAATMASGLGGLAASPALAATPALAGAPALAAAPPLAETPWLGATRGAAHLPHLGPPPAAQRTAVDPWGLDNDSSPPDPTDRGAPPTQRRATVVVRPGDTLWALAAQHLGHGATDAAIAAEWPRWYAANRSTIGPDPNLLLPGMRLTPP